MKELTLTLDNGVTITGNSAELMEFLRLSKESELKVYRSQSRGKILISKMDTNHIRNAIFKIVNRWLASMRLDEDNQSVSKDLMSGLYETGNPELDDLIDELSTRE